MSTTRIAPCPLGSWLFFYGVGQWAVHLLLPSSRPGFSSVSLSLVMIKGDRPADVITVRSNWRLACTLQKNHLSHRDRPAASRGVWPRCWLHTLFACPQVGKDSAQHRAPSLGSFDGVTPSRSAPRDEDFCCFSSHFLMSFGGPSSHLGPRLASVCRLLGPP